VDGIEGSATVGSAAEAWVADAYERHVGAMVALASLLTGDRSAAEDIAHDCFVRVMGRSRSLRHDAPLDAYLRRAVVNACRSRRRHHLIERGFLSSQPRTEPIASPPMEPGDDDPVWLAVTSLPFRQRTAVILRYAEDLSEEQVADAMETSPRAVNALISRAMAILRPTLAQEDER
jgi:RNA polymerase sigma factor (sigma-70 family)